MHTFEELTESRRFLQEICKFHVPSLIEFKDTKEPVFNVYLDDDESPSDAQLKHLTTTATCLSSLAECPSRLNLEPSVDVKEIAKSFSSRAIGLEPGAWKSNKVAPIYCRCRTIPIIVQHLETLPVDTVAAHLKVIFHQIDDDPIRFGIGEGDSETPPDLWYPSNAFHTYWTLELIVQIRNRFPADYDKLSGMLPLLSRYYAGMLLWAKQSLGYQITLHSSKSPSKDSDQLGWSLAIIAHFVDGLAADISEQDVVMQAIAHVFDALAELGAWPHFKPLFHYQNAGYAYCYVFETLTVLLKSALVDTKDGQFLRGSLRPYFQNLLRLAHYADTTGIRLRKEKELVGWCSGHRINKSIPESWATASVFSYLQSLRRLVGIWTRDQAFVGLNRLREFASPKAAEDTLKERGENWRSDEPSVSSQLYTMFINPVRMKTSSDNLEPDSQPIGKNQVRSAILFGPPGTSKTTLARALAGTIGWDYIELHPSHFVADGLPSVQKTADAIFRQIIELDHVVVMLDEVDELVREREKEHEAFERFLTTSMLPRIAQLWHQRKIIYLVGTNHIKYFDEAVMRGERFDSLLFVSPASFASKVDKIRKLLIQYIHVDKVQCDFDQARIDKALTSLKCNDKDDEKLLPSKSILSKFILLRWDDLDALAQALATRQHPRNGVLTISETDLTAALGEVGDFRLKFLKPYREYKLYLQYAKRDCSKERVWRSEGLPSNIGTLNLPFVRQVDTDIWLSSEFDNVRELVIPGFDFVSDRNGVAKYKNSPKP